MLRVHYLQHVPFEGLGTIEGELLQSGHTVSVSRMYESARLPPINDFDWLIVMGGPMGVHDEHQYRWLAAEKGLIAEAVDAQKRVLGICLGAQLIADVLGAKVYANRYKEIGWFPVLRTPDADRSPIGRALPETIDAFHWHGDTFDLPAGAVQLARSDACEQQAFLHGERVLGLQFHLETTRAAVESLVEHCSRDIDGGPFTQSAEAMLARDDRFVQVNGVMRDVLARLGDGALG